MEAKDEGDTDTTSGSEVQLLDSLNWNYKADMNLLMGRLSIPIGNKREKVQNLIGACLSLTEEELDSVDLLKESLREEGTVTSQEEDIPHRGPLEIPEILDKMLSFVPVNTLFTSRLVSKFWNEVSVPWIQEKIKEVTVKPEDFPKLCDDFENAERLLVTKMHIKLDELSLDHCIKFFTQHGSSIRHLQIHEDTKNKGGDDEDRDRPDKEALQKNSEKLNHILRHVPDLRKLTLYLDSHLEAIQKDQSVFRDDELLKINLDKVTWFEICSQKPFSKQFLDGFFKMVPNVKCLEVNFIHGQNWEVFVESMKKLKLNKFLLRFLSSSESLWKALEAHDSLQLKELCMILDIDGSLGNPRLSRSQEDFLNSQANNLEILDLAIKYKDNPNNVVPNHLFQFPVMKILKRASFMMTSNNRNMSNPLNLINPAQVPNLSTLCIFPETISSGLFTNSTFTSIQEIILSPNWKYSNNGLLPQLAARFPNWKKLTNFEISPDNAAIDSMVTNLGNIEDLEVRVLDSDGRVKEFSLIVSGFPPECKSVVYQLGDRIGYESLSYFIDPPRQSLRGLEHLKKLVLDFDSERTKDLFARIDELAVHTTFLRMSPKLRLTLRGGFLISDELAAKLKAHFHSICLVPANTDEVKDKK